MISRLASNSYAQTLIFLSCVLYHVFVYRRHEKLAIVPKMAQQPGIGDVLSSSTLPHPFLRLYEERE
jgi:hypothetical protein